MIALAGPGLPSSGLVISPRNHRQSGDPRQWRGGGGLDAGRIDRTDPDWMPGLVGPNATLETSNPELVLARMRHLLDNNELIDGAFETLENNVIGQGLRCEADTGFPKLDDRIDELFELASERVDPWRSMTLAEHQRLFLRELLTADVGVHFVFEPEYAGHPAGPAIDLIEAERLPYSFTGRLDNGNFVRQGIEFDKRARPIAFHVLEDNPNDGGFLLAFPYLGGPNTVRIPVEDMALCVIHRRRGQLRGLPRAVSVFKTIRTEDSFQRDVMLQAKTAASLGVFFTGAFPQNLFSQGDNEVMCVDAAGRPLYRMEPGAVGFLKTGAQLHTVGTNLPGPNLEQTTSVLQRRMSRGLGVQSSALSGDYSKANFSSIRAENLDTRPGYQKLSGMVLDHHTKPFRRRVIDFALAVGAIDLNELLTPEERRQLAANPHRLYACEGITPGWRYVNPAQEAVANGEDLDNGVTTHPRVIAEKGQSWRKNNRQQARYLAHRAELGLSAPSAGSRDERQQAVDRDANQNASNRDRRVALVAGLDKGDDDA